MQKKYGETKPNRSQELLICLLPGVSFVIDQLGFVSDQLSYHVDSLIDTRNAMLTYSYEHEGRPYS